MEVKVHSTSGQPNSDQKPPNTGISFVQRKSTLTSESKGLLQRLNMLKKEMQKNVVSELESVASHLHSDSSSQSLPLLSSGQSKKEGGDKIDRIRENIIGFNTRYTSPFNIELESVYVDHTATNRPYRAIEDMTRYAKMFMANPHTEFSHFGKYSTEMMNYAHESLLRSFSADPNVYVVLPTGSGSTGAIEKAMKIISEFEKQKGEKPIVYLTPYEHHSNILPWVEFYDHIEVLSSENNGNLVMSEVLQQLKNSPARELIVSVSAASNVTSTITDLKALNAVIKEVRKEKQIIFAADCAAFCSHHELNLKVYDELDFAYLSPHKNLGGSETCGMLIARKEIVKNIKPTFPGGGTVNFVKGYTKTDVMYDGEIFNREIAGTPPFIGFYRGALCFELLKNDIGYEFIHARERVNTELFVRLIGEGNERMREKDGTQIVIYGDSDLEKRANVITLNILMQGQEMMQFNLLSLILADIFGIQLRSGCFCAGPFGIRLLNLEDKAITSIKEEVSVGILKDKPGYLRLDLTFYLEPYEIEYIAQAIIGVAEHSKNMGLVYTVCNDGEIRRHKLFKSLISENYSLANAAFCREQANHDEATSPERLLRRRETLSKQYRRGMEIVKKPIEFLKSQINV